MYFLSLKYNHNVFDHLDPMYIYMYIAAQDKHQFDAKNNTTDSQS